MVSVILICAAIGEMSSKFSFLFCSAPDGAFRVQTAAARACVKYLKPWVPIVPVEGDFGVAILLGTLKSICGYRAKFHSCFVPLLMVLFVFKLLLLLGLALGI